MADEHLFTADVAGPGMKTEGRSRWQSCLIGCLIFFVILIVISILIGFWVARNARNWTATFATEGVREAMKDSQLPAEEQQEIMIQVDRVAMAFREKKISMEQLGDLAGRLFQSPLMSLIVTSTIGKHYFAESGLSDEEKEQGHVTLQRFIRGKIDEKIDDAGFDAAMAHIATRDANNQWRIRDRLTDEQLRAFLAEAKLQADKAGIPEQPADIDPSDEVKKIVDEALAPPVGVGTSPPQP